MGFTTGSSGPGETLKNAREDRQLSIDEVAERLKLSKATITALENDDYKMLPAPAFVRGYLRSYATLLELKVEDVIPLYDHFAPPDPELKNVLKSTPMQKRESTILWVTVVISLILAALVVIWVVGDYPEIRSFSERSLGILNRSNFTETQKESGITVIPPMEVKKPDSEDKRADTLLPVSTGQAEPSGNITKVESSNALELSLAESRVLAEKNSELEVASSAVAKPAQGDDALLIKSTGSSWIAVFDASGYRLLYELLNENSGDTRITGRAPFEIILGDAWNVNLQINGQDFDHSAYIKANRSARFKLKTLE